ncbi:hypothetical protein QLG10_00895 [Pseudomonas sp. V98_8]|nr:hypothetical protein [Pseudomonas sp. V98_8]MDI3390982.1 hypothetical protein [Pseudomonas sp. V98_8]
MSFLLNRRKVITGMGLFGLGILVGCDACAEPSNKYGKGLSDQ